MSTQTHFKNMYIRSININMEDICTGCLCAGRKLHSIAETGLFQVYSQILNEIPVENMSQINIQICWECCALLQKFQQFKAQVKRNYTELLWNVPTPIASHLTSSKVQNLSYPEHNIPEVKSEFQPFTVKIEEADGDGGWKTLDRDVMEDEHQEPETFVNDFAVELEEKPSKKSKKKPKTKKPSKNKIKVKKKKPKPSPEVKSDTDTPQDDFIDADDGEDIEKESEMEKKEEEIAVKKDEKKPEVQNGIKSVKVSNALTGQLLPDRPVCVECGKVFSSKKTYRYHLNVLHKGNNHYPCPRCGKIYQWKSNLGRHMRTHKAVDTGELYCELCDKSFASVATYRQHLRISRRHVSENEFNFTCNECGKKFVNKTRLRDHIDWEHLKKIKFRCQLCNKPFKCHTSLYVHLQNVHTNKEKKDNLCHVCGKSYQNAAKLKYHIIATHTGETPYRCAQCAAAFGWYSSLYRHVREVHYKVKSQPKKTKKPKKIEEPPNYMSYHQ